MERRYARRFDDGRPVAVLWEGRTILAVEPAPESALPEPDLVVSGAFVDVQTNGWAGQEFASPDLTPEAVGRIVEANDAFGVGRFFPTITTQSFEVIRHGFTALAAACDADPAIDYRLPKFHLEGPYMSPEDGARGAHPPEHVRPPDWVEFQAWQAAAGGRIGLVTLSPEYPHACDFIAKAVLSGVVVSIGHTSATPEQIRAAVDAGARMSTHLGNGAHRTLPRHPNYLWEQLAADRLVPSLIADGFHLPPAVLKVILRTKGLDRCVLVSDISGHAGRPVGRYPSMGGEVEILPDGRLVVAGQRQLLAGAGLPIGAGVALLVERLGVPLADAVRTATTVPARLFRLPEVNLVPGDPADLVFFKAPRSGGFPPEAEEAVSAPRLEIRELVVQGKTRWPAPQGG